MGAGATLLLALRSLLRNKVRTGLTMLGIVIGIASVIAMVALGRGASAMIQRQIDSMGRSLLLVMPGAASSSGFSWGAGSVTTLTADDGAAILREVPSVRAVSPAVRTRAQIVYGNQNWVPDRIFGVGAGYLEVREWNVEEGGFFSDSDVASSNRVCVLGRTVVDRLLRGEDPLGKEIRIKSTPFRVVGVLARKGTSAMGMDQDDVVLTPWTTAAKALQGSAFSNVDQLQVSAVSPSALAGAAAEITSLLRQRHRIPEGEEGDFRILGMAEMAGAANETAGIMTVLLAVIASISLVVGGIGIMNIMLVAVVERTREIGIRMAVGARGRDILRQFLAEAVVIAAAAGAAGIGLGVLASAALSRAMSWPTEVSAGSVAVALAFSCGVGVFFGFYPALRASRLDPIEALRHE